MSLQVENGTQIQVPRALIQAFLKQDPNNPGLETVRLPNLNSNESINLPINCREIETEMCLICRRCGRAYPQESSLLSHQRSCYLGNQQCRGALRLVQLRYSCSICDTGTSTRTYSSMTEWRRHTETIQHRSKSDNQRTGQFVNHYCVLNDTEIGEEANPLIDEMEDVVNQITLLAARAAAESTTTITGTTTTTTTSGQQANQDNNNGPEPKRQKLVQEVAAIASAR